MGGRKDAGFAGIGLKLETFFELTEQTVLLSFVAQLCINILCYCVYGTVRLHSLLFQFLFLVPYNDFIENTREMSDGFHFQQMHGSNSLL